MRSFNWFNLIAAFVFLNLYCMTCVSLERFLHDDCTTPRKENGICLVLKSCEPLMALLNEKPRPSAAGIDFLRRSHCGFDGNNPVVCCPLTEPVFRGLNEEKISDVSRHPKAASLLPSSCGAIAEDKIIGGDVSNLFEFPWMALLGYATKSGFQYRCGGTLINHRYVLTVAHCVTNLNGLTLLQVRLGEYNLETERDCEAGKGCSPPVEDYEVEEVVPHEGYLKIELRNDIALIRLKKDVTMSSGIQPICLPVGMEEQKKHLTGKKAIVTGWGTTERGTNSLVLRKASVPIVDVNDCAKIYNRTVPITEKQICAGGTQGIDSCSGDSGGPLQFIGKSSTGEVSYVQYGIVSFGPRRCGMAGKPGVYTRVGLYMRWILNRMKS